MKKNKEVDKLLDAYLAGTCTDAERRLVEQHYLHHLDEAEGMPAPHQVEAAHQETFRAIQSQLQVHRPRSRRMTHFIRYAAAAVLLITFGVIGFFSSDRQPGPQAPTADMVVANDPTSATLTLADGQTITLDESQSAIVVGEEGIAYPNTDSTIATLQNPLFTLATPKGSIFQVTLPDGSDVWLNSASKLIYPNRFDADKRVVSLEGEAYFEVAHQPERPFVVKSDGMNIRVLGTTFNIKKYGSETAAVTTLISGSVEVENTATSQKHILAPGQQSTVTKQETAITKVADVREFVAWKEGLIMFSRATLGEIIPDLERWYDVHFEIEYAPKTKAYIALNRDAELTTVLEALTLNYGVQFKKEERRILVTQ